MSLERELNSIKSFIYAQEKVVVKNHLDLRDKEFVIEGYPHIFSKKIDFKELYRDWGIEPPARTTKQMKHDILQKTRDRHKEDTLNWKYWEELRKDYGTEQANKLF